MLTMPMGGIYGLSRFFGFMDSAIGFSDQSGVFLMQYTGLKDKAKELTDIYEGDIIGANGQVKGNIYETPEVYEEGTDCVIEAMGTNAWARSEQTAIERGCVYAERSSVPYPFRQLVEGAEGGGDGASEVNDKPTVQGCNHRQE